MTVVGVVVLYKQFTAQKTTFSQNHLFRIIQNVYRLNYFIRLMNEKKNKAYKFFKNAAKRTENSGSLFQILIK